MVTLMCILHRNTSNTDICGQRQQYKIHQRKRYVSLEIYSSLDTAKYPLLHYYKICCATDLNRSLTSQQNKTSEGEKNIHKFHQNL